MPSKVHGAVEEPRRANTLGFTAADADGSIREAIARHGFALLSFSLLRSVFPVPLRERSTPDGDADTMRQIAAWSEARGWSCERKGDDVRFADARWA